MGDRGSVESNKKVSIISYGVSLIIFLIIAIWGKFFLKGGDEMGYALMNFYLIMPLVSLVFGIILGSKDAYLKWAYPIVFGILGIIIPSFIFIGSLDWISVFFSLIPALLGLAIGILINKSRNKKLV
ncbi:MAG: hypothetical protein GX078_02055 [Clostridiales bacterium]|nr:hypothetical protein [Clostridiales bacterium]